jgi:hypothetical protein
VTDQGAGVRGSALYVHPRRKSAALLGKKVLRTRRAPAGGNERANGLVAQPASEDGQHLTFFWLKVFRFINSIFILEGQNKVETPVLPAFYL